MSDQITIYGKSYCPYTSKAREAYPNAIFVDVMADPLRMDEMLAHSGGQRNVPVIVKDGNATVGYGGT